MNVVAAVLAAGASRRLGRPKQAVEFGGRALLTRAAEAALAAGCSRVLVVLGHGAASLAALVPEGAEAVVHPGHAEGVGSTVRAAVAAARAGTNAPDGLVLLVCDQPALDAAVVRALLEAWDRAGRPYAAACAYAGMTGTPAVFSAAAFPDLAGLAGDRGARDLLAQRADEVVRVSWPAGALDVDEAPDLP